MHHAIADMPLLAQAPVGARQIVIWSAILIALVIVGYLLIMAVRSRVHPGRAAAEPTTFTLDDLRRLHREGKLTDEEFERARQRTVATSASQLAGKRKDPPAAPPDDRAAEPNPPGTQRLQEPDSEAEPAPPGEPPAEDAPEKREQDHP